MAPDSDDNDDVQATKVDQGGGSPPVPAPEAAATDAEERGPSAAERGDLGTDSVTGTIAVGGGSDTESTIITDVGPPGTDSPVTDSPVTEEGPSVEGAVPESEAGAAEGFPIPAHGTGDGGGEQEDPTGAGDSGGPSAEPGEVVVADAHSPVSDAAEAESVGFDGRPMPGDSGWPDDDTDGSDHVAPPPATEETTTPRRHTRAVVVLSVLSLLVVGAGVGGLIWSRRNTPKATPPPRTQAASPSPTLSDGAFVTFNDPETGTSIRYPRGWTRSEAPVREIRLLVSDGKQFSALVRVTHTDTVTTPANLANVKAVTDGVVGPGAQILKEDPITVNDLIGYRYIYTLTDKDSGLTTAHLHYFLFQGHKMNSIVFEALPSETFSRIEGVFDQMLGSFHSDPEPP